MWQEIMKIALVGIKGEGMFAEINDGEYDKVMAIGRSWHLNHGGYAVTNIRSPSDINKRATVSIHRVVCGIVDDPNLHVDHLNQDKLDNRKSNLLIGLKCSSSFRRMQCMRRGSYGATSIHRGVSYDNMKKKFKAGMRCTTGCYHHLGYFETQEEASAIYEEVLALELARLEKIVIAEYADYRNSKTN